MCKLLPPASHVTSSVISSAGKQLLLVLYHALEALRHTCCIEIQHTSSTWSNEETSTAYLAVPDKAGPNDAPKAGMPSISSVRFWIGTRVPTNPSARQIAPSMSAKE